MLQHAARDFARRAIVKLQSAGYADLTPFQALAISYIELDGSRITELAARLGTTKQAAGEVVANLERQGYIYRSTDRTDKRAVIVHFSKKGMSFLQAASLVKLEIEKEYTALLGEDDFRKLLYLLAKITE
jgi:DNA-binding MarR family transcriptional regulator